LNTPSSPFSSDIWSWNIDNICASAIWLKYYHHLYFRVMTSNFTSCFLCWSSCFSSSSTWQIQ
jgi:hypothetical protein